MFVAEPVPLDVSEPVPNGDRRMFSPLSVTMVYGDKGAVLVDPPMTRAQFEDVAAWVQASGKNLTHIFATHGHGDHWFTADLLAQRFGARVDVIYNGVHQFLVEFKNGGLDAWRKDDMHAKW